MDKDDQIVIYQTPQGETRIEVRLEAENVWLTQAQMTELFERDRTVITRHINNVFKEKELDEKSNVQNLHITFFKHFSVCQRRTWLRPENLDFSTSPAISYPVFIY